MKTKTKRNEKRKASYHTETTMLSAGECKGEFHVPFRRMQSLRNEKVLHLNTWFSFFRQMTYEKEVPSESSVNVHCSKKRTIEEAVDVIYHLLVLLKSKKITINEIHKELDKRK